LFDERIEGGLQSIAQSLSVRRTLFAEHIEGALNAVLETREQPIDRGAGGVVQTQGIDQGIELAVDRVDQVAGGLLRVLSTDFGRASGELVEEVDAQPDIGYSFEVILLQEAYHSFC